ncbi:MAG: tetratricopeptide repeat protein [Bacteroidales bacterium]|nr:tetratricopeptide repeat protein [Bacteroidales bacterium]
MRHSIISALLILLTISASAQTEKKSIRRGNRAYSKGDFVESEVQYRKALENNDHSIKGSYNLAASLYKQEKYEEADEVGSSVNSAGLGAQQQADALYNRANALFKQQKYKECAELYKQAIKLNPNDMQARYNLSETLRMLKQQQDGGGGQNDQQNEDKQDDQDKGQQNDQNENQQNDPNDQQDQNKDKPRDNDKDSRQPNNDGLPQHDQPKISKEDAERMLEAIQQNDKNLQDKMNAQRRQAAKVKPLKNW